MKNKFIKVAAVTPQMKVADCKFNTQKIIEIINELSEKNVNLAVFPELCVTGYTCYDLFFQTTLKKAAENAFKEIMAATKDKNIVTLIGTPVKVDNALFNCAVVIYNGKILGIVPKSNIPCYNEFDETRYFSQPPKNNMIIDFAGETVLFGTNLTFKCEDLEEFSFSVEVCEDLFAINSPSNSHALNGGNIIANLSASPETVEKNEFRRNFVKMKSAQLLCGYVYASSGADESTTDLVFSGHNIISENGKILEESELFSNGYVISEIDVELISNERSKISTFTPENCEKYDTVYFSMPLNETKLTRKVSETPFVPEDEKTLKTRCEEIFNITAHALKKRLTHSRAKTATIGISGGLDSALALLITTRAMDMLNRDRTDIVAVTMPCFGTTKRTKSNAEILCKKLGVTFKEIDITSSVKEHFKDINQDVNTHDVTFENAQARERTQVLMDIANQNGGIVVGTGDLSELALGWATYNGDHMSMYAVNAGIPKTLVYHLVKNEAQNAKDEELKNALLDIVDTPVSPELIPAKEDKITQKTEDIVGPYELHDFFIYYTLRYGFSPEKILRLAKYAFEGEYSEDTIKKWLKTFFTRFFMQQFKRSCLPDGVKIGSVTLSPRNGLCMPSDAQATLWLEEIENL